MEEKPTIFVVDDDHSLCKAISQMVESMDMQSIVYGSAEEFLSSYDPRQGGCLVLDVRMPGMSGLELQEKLARKQAELPIVFITAYGDVPMAVKAVRQGAIDFIEKPFREQELYESIRRAMDRAQEIQRQREAREAFYKKVDTLTKRERDVFNILVRGKCDKEIARKLGITSRAVGFHRGHIFEKLGVRSLVDLVKKVSKLDISF